MAEKTLIDIYQSRPDVQQEVNKLYPGQDPLKGGTQANQWLNDWWNQYGTNENPGVSLVQPKATPTAEELANGTADVTLPDGTTYDTGSTKTNIDSFYKSQQQQIADTIANIKERDKQLAEQQANLQKEKQTWKEKLFGQKSTAEIQAEQTERFGIPEQLQQQQALITDIGTLREKLDKLDVEMQDQIATNEQKPVSTRVISREESRIRETYSRQMAGVSASLNAKAATLQAMQGNLAQAQSFANSAVEAAVYDQQQEYDKFKFFFDEDKDFINTLTTAQQNDLNTLMNYQSSELDRLRTEKTQIMNLSLQYPLAGITPDMTLEQATTAAQGQAGTLAKLDIAQRQAELARTQQLAAGGGEATAPSQYKKLYDEAVSAGYKKTYVEFLQERGVLGGEDMSDKQKEYLSDLMNEITSYSDKESAIEDLNKRKGSITTIVGETGYKQIIDEIKRVLPDKARAEEIAKEESVPDSFFGRLFYGITHPTAKSEFTVINK